VELVGGGPHHAGTRTRPGLATRSCRAGGARTILRCPRVGPGGPSDAGATRGRTSGGAGDLRWL